MDDWTIIISLGCVVALHVGWTFGSWTPYPLPPGPPGLPWVGNVIGINRDAPWETYAEWARTYGDMVYSRLLGKDIIILNSEKIAKDLLEKRSENYSDRPYSIAVEMCGLEFGSGLLPYGDTWRLHRQFFHQTFRSNAIPRFWPLLHRKACHLLRRLLDTPEQFHDHIFEYITSVILNSTYDYDPPSQRDQLVDLVENVSSVTIPALRPDVSVILGAFPLLRHLPSWLPGMSFKRQMALVSELSKQCRDPPFEHALERVAGGSVTPSMVHDALQHIESRGILPEETWMGMLKDASGSAFMAASDTSSSVFMTFLLVMVLNPEAQEKAQAHIDAVVGKNRLPTIADRPLLPFVDAILWETLRYNPVLPLSAPHTSMDDDVYNGFHIPKGAILLANLWSMAHDESKFPNSHAFTPERFINEDGSLKPNEIEHIAFGFGRRICVGRHFADALMWTVIAHVLAVFKMSKDLDENGVEIPVEPRFSSGLTAHPLAFRFRIVPRFSEVDAERLEQLVAATTII